MMARPDGSGVETPVMEARVKRGRRLPRGAIHALRDLLYIQLVDTHGATPADANRVFAEPVDPRQFRKRRQKLAPAVAQHGVLPLISAIIAGPDRNGAARGD